MKICIKCGVYKALSRFYKNKHMADGHVNVCIKCKTAGQGLRESQPSELSRMMYRWAQATNRSNGL